MIANGGLPVMTWKIAMPTRPIRTMICMPIATCRCVIRMSCPSQCPPAGSQCRSAPIIRQRSARRLPDIYVRNSGEIETDSDRSCPLSPQLIPKNRLHIHRLSTRSKPHGCAIIGRLPDARLNLTSHYVQSLPSDALWLTPLSRTSMLLSMVRVLDAYEPCHSVNTFYSEIEIDANL